MEQAKPQNAPSDKQLIRIVMHHEMPATPGQQITQDAQQPARSGSASAPPDDDEPMCRFFFFKLSVSPGGGTGRMERCTMVDCGCAGVDVGKVDGGDEEMSGPGQDRGFRIASRHVNLFLSVNSKETLRKLTSQHLLIL